MVESKHEQPNEVCVILNYEVADALYEYLRHEFISYEHHPKVIELVKFLREKLHHG